MSRVAFVEPRSSSRSADLVDLAKPAALFVFAIGVSIAAWRFHLLARLPELQAWIRSLGAWGPVVFLLLNIACIATAFPAVLFNLAAGALFGLGMGSLLALTGGLGGAALAFLVARFVARDRVLRWLMRHETMRRFGDRTQAYDAVLVVATRILPVFPFNLVNYAWGLTRIRFSRYLLWTAVGKAPNFIFFVAVGAASMEGTTTGHVSPTLMWTLGGLAIVMAVGSAWLRTRLKHRVDDDEPRVGSAGSSD